MIHATRIELFTEANDREVDREELPSVDAAIARLKTILEEVRECVSSTGRSIRIGFEISPIIDVDWLDIDCADDDHALI